MEGYRPLREGGERGERKAVSMTSLFAVVGALAIACLLALHVFPVTSTQLGIPMIVNRAPTSFRAPSMMMGARSMGNTVSGLMSPSISSAPLVSLPEGRREEIWVVNNAKRSLGSTIETGTNIKRRKVSGFRARRATPGGRRVLKSRRAKGRAVLCPASLRKRCKGGQYSKHSGQQEKPRMF
mmetsp:Transcript_20700/g.50791  ORF Transcript_20700/g.50791 Transcript_20700/m.50791 type:complete len:182 (-) Transcript_20700:132-677(-)